MGKDKRNAGLDALKALRDRVPNSVLKTVIAPPVVVAPRGPAGQTPAEPDDAALFRRHQIKSFRYFLRRWSA